MYRSGVSYHSLNGSNISYNMLDKNYVS